MEKKKQSKNLLSFNGRISSSQYLLTVAILVICLPLVAFILGDLTRGMGNIPLSLILFITYLITMILWIVAAAGAKRCHDLGKSGWWQLIPFYFIVLMFKKGQSVNDKQCPESTVINDKTDVEIKEEQMNTKYNPFTFNGRIRRRTYWIVGVVLGFISNILTTVLDAACDDLTIAMIFLTIIVLFYVQLANGAKRCHDLGHNGWWQLIPFYNLWMAFQDSEHGTNEYGPNPKGE